MMLLNWFAENRLVWQEKTQQKIKNQLLIQLPETISKARDQKLVVVSGKPQVGKTSMILSLMGINEEKHGEISKILRAGIPEGNSSTSTAIVYQRSNDNEFGICQRTFAGEEITPFVKCGEDVLQERLKEIRRNVEAGVANQETILYLYIPQSFFAQETFWEDSFSILDVPGEGSRNVRESVYADALLRRYTMAASLNILVREMNDINDLRDLADDGGNRLDYSYSRYIVVTTRSYSQENIRNYFTQEFENRKTTFKEYLEKILQTEFERIFPDRGPHYFAVEVGQSYQKLVRETLTTDRDRKEIQDFRNSVFAEIRQRIGEQKGDSLSGWISYMKEEIDAVEKRELLQIRSEIDDIHQDIEAKNLEIQKSDQRRKNILETIERKIGELKNVKGQLDKANIIEVLSLEDQQAEQESEKIKEGIFSQNERYSQMYANKFGETILAKIEKAATETWSKEEIQSMKNQLLQEATALEETIKQVLKAKTSFWTSKKNKKEICLQLVEEAILRWDHKIRIALDQKKEANESALKEQQRRHDEYTRRKNAEKERLEKQCKELKNILARKRLKEAEVEKTLHMDQECLSNFKQVAREVFNEEKGELLSKIQDASSAEMAACYAILLGLMCQDYERMIIL